MPSQYWWLVVILAVFYFLNFFSNRFKVMSCTRSVLCEMILSYIPEIKWKVFILTKEYWISNKFSIYIHHLDLWQPFNEPIANIFPPIYNTVLHCREDWNLFDLRTRGSWPSFLPPLFSSSSCYNSRNDREGRWRPREACKVTQSTSSE